MKNNPLLDTHFLKQLDLDNQKEVFIKIVSLNKDEEPVEISYKEQLWRT